MPERKIRLTLSSTIVNNIGALIDVDFNGENLDADLEVTAENGVSSLIKEYAVNVPDGTYNLEISFKNDVADDEDNNGTFETDRNLIIEKIEIAKNGIDFNPLIVNSLNSSNVSFDLMGWLGVNNPNYDPNMPKSDSNNSDLLNPDYNSSMPRTDDEGYNGYTYGDHPGNNPKFLLELVINPVTMFVSSTATFQINFS